MSLSNDLLGHKAVFKRPRGPDAGDSGGGIDENAVHVEKYAAAANRSHRLCCFPLINFLATRANKITGVWRNKEGWGGRRGLNPRHSVPQTDALPAELLPPPGNSLQFTLFSCDGKVDNRRRRKPCRVRDVHGQFTSEGVWPDPLPCTNRPGRAAHPISVTGIARNRVKRLQYA